MNVVISYSAEIENCYECIFRRQFRDMGASWYVCTAPFSPRYPENTPPTGIAQFCPFLKGGDQDEEA